MTRPLEVPLAEHGVVAERGLRLASRGRRAPRRARRQSARRASRARPLRPRPSRAAGTRARPGRPRRARARPPRGQRASPRACPRPRAAPPATVRRRRGPPPRPPRRNRRSRRGTRSPGGSHRRPVAFAARMCSSEWRYEAISTVSSASARAASPASSGAATATVAIPSSRQVRKMRTAISPRFATRSFRDACQSQEGGRFSRNARKPVLALVARPPVGGARQQILLVARLEHEPLRLADGGRAAGEDVGDDPLDRRVEIGGDLVDEPDPQRRRRVEALAGEEVAPRVRSGRSSPAPSARSRTG